MLYDSESAKLYLPKLSNHKWYIYILYRFKFKVYDNFGLAERTCYEFINLLNFTGRNCHTSKAIFVVIVVIIYH